MVEPGGALAPSASRPPRPDTRPRPRSPGLDTPSLTLGRLDQLGGTGTPVLRETVRQWCGRPEATITVKPVLDLADHVHLTAYEVPDRIRARVEERDLTCASAHCAKPAKRCDTDHVIPHNRGGPTCAGNLTPLCRRHHRAKTHGRWSYRTLRPGAHLWTTPNGYLVLRDHSGTHPVVAPSPDP